MVVTSSSLLAEVPDLPGHEVRRLLLAAVGEDAAFLVGDRDVSDAAAGRFRSLVARRRDGEPLQYIEGSAPFGPVELTVDRRALIPRPETERLFEVAVQAVSDLAAPVIVDLCTGSGNLAFALKSALPAAEVVATDVSEEALSLASENRTALGLDVGLFLGDLFAPLPAQIAGSVDLLVSNPPYVTNHEYSLLPEEVASYEPFVALVGGPDGLDVLRRIAAEAGDWLRPGATLVCEIGELQGPACTELFAAYRPEILRDHVGRDRFVIGTAPMAAELH